MKSINKYILRPSSFFYHQVSKVIDNSKCDLLSVIPSIECHEVILNVINTINDKFDEFINYVDNSTERMGIIGIQLLQSLNHSKSSNDVSNDSILILEQSQSTGNAHEAESSESNKQIIQSDDINLNNDAKLTMNDSEILKLMSVQESDYDGDMKNRCTKDCDVTHNIHNLEILSKSDNSYDSLPNLNFSDGLTLLTNATRDDLNFDSFDRSYENSDSSRYYTNNEYDNIDENINNSDHINDDDLLSEHDVKIWLDNNVNKHADLNLRHPLVNQNDEDDFSTMINIASNFDELGQMNFLTTTGSEVAGIDEIPNENFIDSKERSFTSQNSRKNKTSKDDTQV